MKQVACEFGENKRLKGILTCPVENKRENIALVLVSAGFTAKSGPYRMYAELARSLAALGIATLRFDLGGIGNSQTLNPGSSLDDRTKHDIGDAIDYLYEQHNVKKFVVGGLCSGAEDAFRYAENDVRAVGVLLIDPHAYRTRMWSIRNVFSWRFRNRVVYKLLRVLGVISDVRESSESLGVDGLEQRLIDYKYMSLQESTRILTTLLDRRVHLHYVYSGGRIAEFNHKRQIYDMFGDVDFGDYLTLDYIPHIEHTQVFEEDRNELLAAICRRMNLTCR